MYASIINIKVSVLDARSGAFRGFSPGEEGVPFKGRVERIVCLPFVKYNIYICIYNKKFYPLVLVATKKERRVSKHV